MIRPDKQCNLGGVRRPGFLIVRMPLEEGSVAPRRRRAASARRAVKRQEPQPALPTRGAEPRYSMVRYPDNTLRPERYATRRVGMKRQVEADMFGNVAPLSTGVNMRDITSVLTEVISRLNLKEAEFAPEFLAQVWKDAVGDFLASQSQLISLSNGCAIIRAPHPTVCFELRRQSRHLIQALNESFGEGCVRSVNIRQR